MLNLHHLHLLRTVASCQSYSRAAEQLGITQPAVSMQIRKLEESVALPLVTTRGRLLVLTEAGQTLVTYADRILRLGDEAEQAMAQFRGLHRGHLRVAASSTPGAYLLPAALAEFRRDHPEVGVTLEVGNTRMSLGLVEAGLVDLAVVGEAAADEVEVRLQPLCDDCLTVVVAPGHPWAARQSITPAELAAEPLILREEGSNTRAVLDRRLTAATGSRANAAMLLSSTEAVKEAVAAGLGAAVLSGLAVRWEVQSGRLVAVPVAGLDLCRRLQWALAPAASPLANAFMEYLKDGVDR